MASTFPENKIVLSIPEAANALALSRSTIYELIDSGDLVRIKHGNRAMITLESAQAFVARLVAEQHPDVVTQLDAAA